MVKPWSHGSVGVGVASALPGPTTEWDVGGGGSCKEISAVGLLFAGTVVLTPQVVCGLGLISFVGRSIL